MTDRTPKTKRYQDRDTTRLNLRHQDSVRTRIKASQIITRLQAFVLGRPIGKKPVEMTDAQVRAAFGLLAKIIPDLHRTELVGDVDQPVHLVAQQVTQQAAAEVAAAQTPTDAAIAYQRLMGLGSADTETPPTVQ